MAYEEFFSGFADMGSWVKVHHEVARSLYEAGVLPKKSFEDLSVLLNNKSLLDNIFLEVKLSDGGDEYQSFLNELRKVISNELGDGDPSWTIGLGTSHIDIIDTAFCHRLLDPLSLIDEKVRNISHSFLSKSYKHKYDVMIHRNNGVKTEPTTFGLLMLSYFCEINRHIDRMTEAFDGVRYGKMSGQSGSYSYFSIDQENDILKKLNLYQEECTIGSIGKDRFNELAHAFYQLACFLIKVIRDWSSLSKEDIGEICLKYDASKCLEACIDIKMYSSSLFSREEASYSRRNSLISDMLSSSFLAIDEFHAIMDNMSVYNNTMQRNLDTNRKMWAKEKVIFELLKCGFTNDEAKSLVIGCMREVASGNQDNFYQAVMDNKEIVDVVGKDGIKKCFSIKNHLLRIDDIFFNS